MSSADPIQLALVFGPILALLVLGTWLTGRSGVVSLGNVDGLWRLVSNLSWTALLVSASLLALMVLQRMAGFRLDLAWS